MSEVEYLRRLLDNRWTESITGRPNDAPKPMFVETTENLQKRLRTKDVCYITAPGTSTHTPKGFTEIGTIHQMQLDIRAKDRNTDANNVFEDPYKRLFDERDENNEAYRWPGVAGEAQRVIFDVYRGHKEFDLVTPPEVEDLSGQTGPNSARATISVELERISYPFDTST